jgi:hypothetical protein
MRYLSLFLGLNLCFALLAAQTGAAQNNPIVDVGVFNAPISNVSRAAAPKSAEPVFNKKIFWTEVGGYTVPNILDGFTTIARPQGYEEAGFPRGSSFLLGTQPCAARYVVTMGAMQVATSFAAYQLEHSHRRFLRLVGHALMIQGIYAHTDGSIRNFLGQGNPGSVAQLASTTLPVVKRF